MDSRGRERSEYILLSKRVTRPQFEVKLPPMHKYEYSRRLPDGTRKQAIPHRLRLAAGTLAAVCAMLILIAACTPRQPGRQQILVFAAASLTESLTELAEEFERTHGTEVSFSFGASQSLSQQIANGAPADLFVAAGMFPVDSLRERNHIEDDVDAILSNKLVVVAAPDVPPIESLGGLADESIERVAVADPRIAPAGAYARESLRSLGIWESIETKLVFGVDVRATLAYVEAGNVDVALVYSTDAKVAESLTVLDIVPIDSYSPIIYPAVVPKLSDKKDAAREFLTFLKSDAAMKVFAEHGFRPAPDSS